MKYEKQNWEARQGTGLNRFLKSGETPSVVYLDNVPEAITKPGSSFSTERMNHMEDGIAGAYEEIAAEALERQYADTALQTRINAESQTCRQNVNDLRSQVADLVRLIESNLGPIPRFLWVTDDGDYVVTNDLDYIALA